MLKCTCLARNFFHDAGESERQTLILLREAQVSPPPPLSVLETLVLRGLGKIQRGHLLRAL